MREERGEGGSEGREGGEGGREVRRMTISSTGGEGKMILRP